MSSAAASVSVSVATVVSSLSLVVIPGWPLVTIRLTISVVPVSVLAVTVVTVSVLIVTISLPVSVVAILVVTIIPTGRRIVPLVLVITSIVIPRRRSSLVSVPVIISVSVISVTVSATRRTATAAARVTESEARSGGLAVVEIHSRCWLVGILGDGEVHSDLEAGNLCPIESLSCLLCITNLFKVDESKSS